MQEYSSAVLLAPNLVTFVTELHSLVLVNQLPAALHAQAIWPSPVLPNLGQTLGLNLMDFKIEGLGPHRHSNWHHQSCW